MQAKGWPERGQGGSDGAAGQPLGAVFRKNWVFRPFWASGVLRMGPDRP